MRDINRIKPIMNKIKDEVILKGLKTIIEEKIKYLEDYIKPNNEYEFEFERDYFNQIKGKIEGLKIAIKIIDDILKVEE